MQPPRLTVTRSRRWDIVVFLALLVLIALTGRRRLRVYFEAPTPVVEQPR